MYALEDMGITALPADADEDIVRGFPRCLTIS